MRYPLYIFLFVVGTVLCLFGTNTLKADDGLLNPGPHWSSYTQTTSPANAETSAFSIEFEIDRSQVPSLSFYDLTLNVLVNDASSVQVLADSVPISHTYSSLSGEVSFTTSASNINIMAQGVSNLTDFGTISKGALLDNKGFAWSHGLDDNVLLNDQVELLENFGWRGTFFLIASDIDDTRDESWVADRPYLEAKLASGWSLGNHTWDHGCTPPFAEDTITRASTRLQEIVSTSDRPDYKVTSFAAPCLAPEYHPVLVSVREGGTTDLRFNESGNLWPLWVDTGASEEILDSETQLPNAYPFTFDIPVGRSTNLSAGGADDEIETIDWIASRHAETGEHFWFNTLSHGDDDPSDDVGDESQLERFATHVYTSYGPAGTNKIWVAPSDQIYSYLLVRELSTIVDSQVFDASGGTVVIPTRIPPTVVTPTPADVYLPFTAQ